MLRFGVGLTLAAVLCCGAAVPATAAPPSCPLFMFPMTAYQSPVTVSPPCNEHDGDSWSVGLGGPSPHGSRSSGHNATFTPNRGCAGSTTVTLLVTDSAGEKSSLIVTIGVAAEVRPPNRRPVARCEFYNARLGGRLSVPVARGLLANDLTRRDPLAAISEAEESPWQRFGRMRVKRDGSFRFEPKVYRPLVLRCATASVGRPGAHGRGGDDRGRGPARRLSRVRRSAAQGQLVASFSLRALAGAVRAGGRKPAAHCVRRPLMVDARAAGADVGVEANRLERFSHVGSFSGGLFWVERSDLRAAGFGWCAWRGRLCVRGRGVRCGCPPVTTAPRSRGGVCALCRSAGPPASG